jgi:tellurite resistance protein
MGKGASISPQEALIYAMVAASAVDRTITDRELAKIGEVVKSLPVFADFDPERLVSVAQACGRLLQGQESLQIILEVIAETVPEHLRDTAYALAVEVAFADVGIGREEQRFLVLLRRRLDVDHLTAAAIDRAMTARHREL